VDLENRHPSVQAAARWLIPNPNLPPRQRRISEEISMLTGRLTGMLGDGPEMVLGLRTLTEAKNLFVQQSLVDEENEK
jgi:hypothetical protein